MDKQELVDKLIANGYSAEIEDGVPIVRLEVRSHKELNSEIQKIDELKQGYDASFGWKVRCENEL